MLRQAGMLLALAGTLLASSCQTTSTAQAPPINPAVAASLDSASLESHVKDLSAFRGVAAREKAYTAAARAEAEKRLDALEAALATTSDAAFVLELSRIVALADNGHSQLGAGGRSRRFNRADIRLVPFGEDFYVLRAKDPQLLGARLVAIDGHEIGELRTAARSLTGGTAAWRDRSAPFFLESPEQLHAAGLSAEPGKARYLFATPGGRTFVRELQGARGAAPLRVQRMMDPTPDKNEGEGWLTVLSPDTAPWTLTGGAGPPFRWRDAPEMDAVFIELRQMSDAGDQKLVPFLEDAEAQRVKLKRRNVVLDLRFNGGGNLQLARRFLTAWPDKLIDGGRIAVLVSPYTFSAAISSAMYLRQAGGPKVILVGETPGDRPVFWAENNNETLPSGLGVGYSRERHDYADGCKAFSDCHPPVKSNPIAVPTFDPDIPAPWTFESYAAGRDPAVEAAAKAFGG